MGGAGSRGAQAGPQEAFSPPGAPAPRGPRQRRRIFEEAAAPAGGHRNGGAGGSWLGALARGRGPEGVAAGTGRSVGIPDESSHR